MRTTLALLLFARALLPLSSLEAQDWSSMAPGMRVRVQHCISPLRCPVEHGTLVRAGEDSLVLAVEYAGAYLSVPMIAVRRLEVSRGRWPNIRRGMLGGAVSLGSVGLIVGLLATTTECSEQWLDFTPCEFGPREVAGITALAAGVGAVWGGLIGAVLGETWQPVSPSRYHVSPIPAAGGGIGLLASVRF